MMNLPANLASADVNDDGSGVEVEDEAQESDQQQMQQEVVQQLLHSTQRQHNLKRWFLFVFSFVTICCVAGVIYGWPALRRQLIQDAKDNAARNGSGGSIITEEELGVIYTVGSWSVQGGRFIFGVTRDKCFGTRTVACGSLILAACGALGIAISDPTNIVGLSISLFLMGLGAGFQLCVQPVGSLFGNYSSTIISSLSGSFQISGLVYLILSKLPTSRFVSYLGYTIVLLLFAIISWNILPHGDDFQELFVTIEEDEKADEDERQAQSGQRIKPEEDDGDESLSEPAIIVAVRAIDVEDSEDVREVQQQPQQPPKQVDVDDDKNDENLSLIQQVCSLEYILLVGWFSLCLLPLQFYIGSIGFQLEYLGDSDGNYASYFSIIFAAAAIIAPVGGYLCDTFGFGITQGISTILVSISFIVLGIHQRKNEQQNDETQLQLRSLQIQLVSFVCYSIGRMMIFAAYFSNIGKRFGYTYFGTLSGVGLLLSALLSLLQYQLIATASSSSSSSTEDNDDDSYGAAQVDIMCGVALLSLTLYCIWLAIVERRYSTAQSLLGHRKSPPSATTSTTT